MSYFLVANVIDHLLKAQPFWKAFLFLYLHGMERKHYNDCILLSEQSRPISKTQCVLYSFLYSNAQCHMILIGSYEGLLFSGVATP